MPEGIEPTSHYVSFGPRVALACYGRKTGRWNTKENPDPDIYERIARVVRKYSARVVYCPYADFSARVISPHEFIQKGKRSLLESVSVWNSVHADGVQIRPQEAFFIASGDCPTIVAFDSGGDKLVATHAGRDCLFDRQFIETGKSSRGVPSVVDAIVGRLGASNISVAILCGIGADSFRHPWSHPKYGKFNRKMVEYLFSLYGSKCVSGSLEEGCLNLPEIIRAQFVSAGVSSRQIHCDEIDTYSDRESDEPLWWSSVRGDKERNGVFAIFRG
jgi:copper oxidase (laccase) domain-containing protein